MIDTIDRNLIDEYLGKTHRREFLSCSLKGMCALAILSSLGGTTAQAELALPTKLPEEKDFDKFIKDARYFEQLPEKKIRCLLCPRECEITDLERGYCGVRENQGGVYKTLVYGRVCSLAVDPVEKKPLFHFLPGTTALSLATAGCNIECKFCQNWQISQFRPEQVRAYHIPPKQMVNLALEKKCPTIAYTYSEPVVFYEYMYDIAQHGRAKGVKSVIISNGYINKKPMRELCKQLDGVKVDFKGFTEKFYKDSCNGELKPVLDTLVLLKEIGIWFEMVVLLVPTLNDSSQEIRDMSKWIMENLGEMAPLHFTRFHPQYKMKNLPPTPIKTLERAHGIAKDEGLKYVYLGNVPGHKLEHTYCHNCGELLIERVGMYTRTNKIENSRCSKCKAKIPGVWS